MPIKYSFILFSIYFPFLCSGIRIHIHIHTRIVYIFLLLFSLHFSFFSISFTTLTMTNKMCMILWSVDIPLQFCKYFVAAHTTTHTHTYRTYNRLTNTFPICIYICVWVCVCVCVCVCTYILPFADSWYNFKRIFGAVLTRRGSTYYLCGVGLLSPPATK